MAITVFDKSGTQIKTAGKEAPKSDNKFDFASESIPHAIARNIYKPVASTVSTLAGMPGDAYNTLASLMNIVADKTNPYLSVGDQEAGGNIPYATGLLTSEGVRDEITKPAGEDFFGVGSQDPQPGALEGIIDKASQYVPYAVGGAVTGGVKGLLSGLGTNIAQGIAGQGIKSLGGGPGMQLAGEIVTGLGAPVIGKLTGGRADRAILKTAKELKVREKTAWDLVDSKAIEAGKVSASKFEDALLKAEGKLNSSVLPKNRKASSDLLNESFNLIGIDDIGVDSLVQTRQKINDGLMTIKSGGAKSALKGLKNTVDEELGKYLGTIHSDAVDLTKTIKQSDLFSNALKGAKNKLEPSKYDWVKGAVSNLIPFAASASLYAHPKILVGALATHLGTQVAINAKKVLGDPTMRPIALKALRKIGASNVLPAALGIKKVSEDGAVKPRKATGGITLLG